MTISVVVRSATPHQTADPVVENMHSRLMADLTLNGNAIDIQPANTSLEFIDADQAAVVVGCNYDIIYRTNIDDLSS